MQLEQFSRKSVNIEPGIIEMLSPIELTQYYIQVSLNFLYFVDKPESLVPAQIMPPYNFKGGPDDKFNM